MPTNIAEFDLLTMTEVAQLLHCSKAHVSKALAGRVTGCTPIPSVHLGRRALVRRASLLHRIEENEQTPAQRTIMRQAMLAMPGVSVIAAATDSDKAGGHLAAGIKEIFDDCGCADLTFRRGEPVAAKDWNEFLTKQGGRPLLRLHGEPSVS